MHRAYLYVPHTHTLSWLYINLYLFIVTLAAIAFCVSADPGLTHTRSGKISISGRMAKKLNMQLLPFKS